MISKELELACEEITDNDNYEFVRRLFENLSTRFLARLIIDSINFLPWLSAEKNSLRDRLNALIRASVANEKIANASNTLNNMRIRDIDNSDNICVYINELMKKCERRI